MNKPFGLRYTFLLIVSMGFLASCGGKDSICDCIEAGDKLNRKANALLESGSSDDAGKELLRLKEEKKKKCAEFETMDGNEMKRRMQDCQ